MSRPVSCTLYYAPYNLSTNVPLFQFQTWYAGGGLYRQGVCPGITVHKNLILPIRKHRYIC